MEKKILILTNFFTPGVEMAAVRLKSITKYLKKMGWDIFVLTKQNVNVENNDSVIKDDKIIYSKDIIEELNNKRKLQKKANKGHADENTYGGYLNFKTKVRIIAKLIYKKVHLNLWVISSYLKVRKIIKKNDIKKVMCTVPHIEMLMLGVFIKKFHKDIELIEEIRDSISINAIYNKSLNKVEQKYYYNLEKRCLKHVDKYIFLTSNLEEIYFREFNLKNKKVTVITNGYDKEEFLPIEYKKNEVMTVSHIGTFYGTRNPLEFLKAISKLKEKLNINIRVNLIGKFFDDDIKLEVLKLIESCNLDVVIKDYVSHEEALIIEQKSDFNLIITHKNAESSYALPGKVFEYIGANRPIIAITNDELLIKLIVDYNIGRIIIENNQDSIYSELLEIFNDWKCGKYNLFAKNTCLNIFDRELLSVRIDEFLICRE